MVRLLRLDIISKTSAMKNRIILPLLLAFATTSFAQLTPGFNKYEARDMISLCNSFNYLEEYGTDASIVPSKYKLIYSSPIHGMDNRFQVYTSGNKGVINFRGSTDKKSSWLENFYSAMIPAEGIVKIKDRDFHYKFGDNPESNVHSGYVLGLAYMHEDLLAQINKLNKKGIFNIYLTGHSQGGALANLFRCYLDHLPSSKVSEKNQFKVYTFAQPMIGNIELITEYNNRFCDSEMSHSLINPDDKVPAMPMSFNDSSYWRSNLMSLLSKEKEFDRSQMLKDGMINLFQKKLQGTASAFGRSVEKQIEKELGQIELPNPTGDINFEPVGNIIYLDPPEYPLELKDSSILNNEEFLATHPRDQHGIFEHKSVYKKTSMSQNHKPYNYYTAVLRKYFPKEYANIEPKSFGL